MNFTQSETLLNRACQLIPGGTGTFSKSKTQYPVGVSPFYIQRGKGSHVWDIDGNEYIDFVSGLTPIILGYCDEDVDNAVRWQMNDGVTFSLPNPVEVNVAEKICEMVPNAEMVRFGKNGSDATSGAVRVARAYTGRDHVITCGYHGWQDWYIGITGRNKGVPQAIRALTHSFTYNDLDSLYRIFHQYPEQVACVIMEPMNRDWPNKGFLEGVREMAHKNHALFILDENITGFRFAKGGAQEYFKVDADLACFGKAIANGYPLSAITGKADIMRTFEDVHFSFTYSGECLSLAAAEATLTKIQKEPVLETIYKNGGWIAGKFLDWEESSKIKISGHWSWTHLNFPDDRIQTLFKQEMFSRGILILNSHNLNYSHSDDDIEKLFAVYKELLPTLHEQELRCKVPEGLFKVR